MPRWDSASKDKQRLLIQQQRPWMRSTGPRSEYGRQISSRNAAKKKRTLSQQLHFGFTAFCENAAEVALDVAFVSHTDRPMEIGDRVIYVGDFAPTMFFCGHEPMLVAGFCQLGTGAIVCKTSAGKLIWFHRESLERV